MAGITDADISNLALQKLGTSRITSLLDATPNARAMNAIYTITRDAELRKYAWKFAISRAVLAASAIAPVFGPQNAFNLPTDYLRIILPPQFALDWQIESGQILTNDGAPLNIRYVRRVIDPTQFDPAFVEAFACRLGWTACEQVTQSTSKKEGLADQYKQAIADARRANAFEATPIDAVEDSWLVARDVGMRYLGEFGTNWNRDL